MALSDIYKDPKRLDQIQKCGPLVPFFDGFQAYLEEQGFFRETQMKHICAAEGLSVYLKKYHKGWFNHLPEIVVVYLDKSFSNKENKRKEACYGLNRFLCYLTKHHNLPVASAPVPYQIIYEKHRVWQEEVLQLKTSTVELRKNYLFKFLSWYDHKSHSAPLSRITYADIEDFFLNQTSEHGRSFKRSLQSTLRCFFKFCYEKRICKQDLSGAVPKIRRYRLDQAPRAIPESEAQKLLECIDRETNSGKRTYAIILLLYTYGVRCGQVQNLLLEDIDWHNEQIFFRAQKNAKSSRVPLNTQVGNAILDYLQQVRPSSQYHQVFLTMRAPYQPFARSNTLDQIIRSVMLKHNITSPSSGGHCLRHAFVARLLKQGESFKSIADLVGHRYMSTTFIYTKIDFRSLAEVGLTLPEV